MVQAAHDVLLIKSVVAMDLIPQPYYWSSEDFGGSPPLGTRSGWMALACMPFVLYIFQGCPVASG